MDDRDFFQELYREHIQELLRYARRRVDRHLAEDLVDETYLAAWAAIKDIRAHPAPRKWLFRTLFHKCSHELERKSYQMEISTELSAMDVLPAELEGRILELLPVGLSREDEELLILRYEQRMDFRDIAERLGIREEAARKRVTRAVARCRKLLLVDGEPQAR